MATNNPEQFHFIEHHESGEPIEQRLRSIAAVVRPVDVAGVAERFVRLHTTDRRGELREPEAALQNRVLSWYHQGLLADPSVFAAEFTRAAQDVATGKQLSKEVHRFLAGVTGAFLALRALEDDERREQARHPERRQFLGVNATIDARSAIDLVDIRYTPSDPLLIDRIALIQAKMGSMTDANIATTVTSHRAYFREHLAPWSTIEHREQLAHAERDMSKEIAEHPEEARDVAARTLVASYERAFIECLFGEPPDLALVNSAAREAGIPPARMHLFLRGPSLPFALRVIRDLSTEPGDIDHARAR